MTGAFRPTLWARIYRTATWVLVGLFVILALAHVVLTVLFFLGVWDTGVGFFLSFEWPGWLITIIDAAAALALWLAYRRGVEAPWFGLALTLLASAIMLARAMWMVFVPVLVAIVIGGAIGRIRSSPRTAQSVI